MHNCSAKKCVPPFVLGLFDAIGLEKFGGKNKKG